MRKAAAAALYLLAGTSLAQVVEPPPLPTDPLPANLDGPMLLPGEELILTPPPAEPPPELPSFRLRLAPEMMEEPILPPLELMAGNSLAAAPRVKVKSVRFRGNHVFSSRTLHRLVAPLEGREVTMEELEAARQAVTLHYVQAGYINSGALLEDQDVSSGEIVMTVVEGRLTKIELTGNWWYRPWWLRNEVRRFAGRPLNEKRLREGLQLLRQSPGIQQVNAELLPGLKPGEAILDLSVKERHPFHLFVDYSNSRPPSVGSQIVTVQASDLNLTGHDDPLVVSWGILQETDSGFEYGAADNLSGSYTFPVTPWATTLELRASRSDSSIIEEAFQALDITSQTTAYGATLRQPIYQSLRWDAALSVGFDRKMNDTFLLQRPFSLSPGAIDGETEVDVLRVGLELTNRSTKHVLAFRSTFNWGLDLFDATITRDLAGIGTGPSDRPIPDGRFFSWVGQAQYVRRLTESGILAVARINAQLSDSPLLSLEQFPVGGVNSVRGYRENTLLRDNGVFGSVELRIPVWQVGKDDDRRAIVTLVPFVDIGSGWRYVADREVNASNEQDTLESVGVGVIVEPNRFLRAQLYWGYALNRDFVIKEDRNLQDYGLHFSVSVIAF